jgi:tRNA-splicing ligase RtcB
MQIKEANVGPLQRVDDYCWRLPASHQPGMRVDGLVFASRQQLDVILSDRSIDQVANVAHLPGIQRASLAMPDIHWGYGFCIGGVAATDPEEGGVISPGGVGYDINCGVRLLRTGLELKDIKPHLKALVDQLFRDVPTGPGQRGPYRFGEAGLKQLMRRGPIALVEQGFGSEPDITFTEAGGQLEAAEPERLSERALSRGAPQCGTLGGGNHFLEVQAVERIVDADAARALGLEEGMVCVTIHSGSRGLGYQVCQDALDRFRDVPERYGIELPDRQLACAPLDSEPGRHYLGAMRAAANFAWCNRHMLMHLTRHAFQKALHLSAERVNMQLLYDVAHNIAKMESHQVGDRTKRVCVHRKGATRAFPPGHAELPEAYRAIGQPVLIPGDMGRASWVLVGRPGSMQRSFGSSCHGAGRAMSRRKAVKAAEGRHIDRELAHRGVIAKARGWRGLAEEQPDAYKDVDHVVEVVENAGLSSRVARLRPIGVIKG